MYISRVEIDRKNHKNLKELSHLGAYHNWVERLFPKEFETAEHSRKLWRIDTLNNKEYLLVISETAPNLEAFNLYGVIGSAETKVYDTFLNSLKNGQQLRFRATLNPVISRSTGKESGERGKVFPHLTVAQQMEFLKERAFKNGFILEVNSFFVSHASYETLKKEGKRPIKISKVSYEGQLKISDITVFKEVLTKGLGKKKAYGCGMITVIPIS